MQNLVHSAAPTCGRVSFSIQLRPTPGQSASLTRATSSRRGQARPASTRPRSGAVDLLDLWTATRPGWDGDAAAWLLDFTSTEAAAAHRTARAAHPEGRVALNAGFLRIPRVGLVALSSADPAQANMVRLILRRPAPVTAAEVHHKADGAWWVQVEVAAQRAPARPPASVGVARGPGGTAVAVRPDGTVVAWLGSALSEARAGEVRTFTNRVARAGGVLVLERDTGALWSELARQLTYRAAWRGDRAVFAPRTVRPRHACSRCAASQSTQFAPGAAFRCSSCDLVVAGVVNTAAVLAMWGEQHPSLIGDMQSPRGFIAQLAERPREEREVASSTLAEATPVL
jgi:hypothetical protein